jgi:hypothetical protein
MAFGQDFLNGFFGNDYLRDYSHASKTFRTNGYANSPRFKFLFHVYFNINTTAIPQLGRIFDAGETATIGLLVKNIELPSYKIDVETMNQYNRKRLVQKKIEYQPIKVAMHDDGGDLVRQMWYNYFSYYYKDPSQAYRGQTATNGSSGPSSTQQTGFGYATRDIYAGVRAVNDWGYIGESYSDGTASPSGKPAFFRDISIYGFNQHKFVEYVLINPMISEWRHDTYDYSEAEGVMENTLTIDYETVKYYTGAIGGDRPDTNVQGFADPASYDNTRSPLGRPGGTQSVLGQGGLLDAGIGIYQDLQAGSVAGVIGAVQTAGRTYGTFKGKDLQAIVREEAIQGARDVLRNDIPAAVRGQPNGRGSSIQEQLQAPQFNRPPLSTTGFGEGVGFGE